MQATRVCLLVAVLDSARLASLMRTREWQYVLAAISTTYDRIERGRRLVKRRGDVVCQELVGGGEAEKTSELEKWRYMSCLEMMRLDECKRTSCLRR